MEKVDVKIVVPRQIFLYHVGMKPQVLCAWLGRTDINASKGRGEAGKGPILQALDAGGYAALTLLSNYSQAETKDYTAWVREKHPAIEISLHMVELSSPTDFAEIYEAAVGVLDDFAASRPDYELTFHLSPGTPSMAAVWILMASGRYRADLVEASKEQGVKEVRMPFEIMAEYHPKYERRIDSKLIGISDEMLPGTPAFDKIIHSSEPMKRTVNLARRVSTFDVPVLLLGESGTGKELFARAIHYSSHRADGPFIPVNCGALPEGLVESEIFGYVKGAFTGAVSDKKGYIEQADGGTLFLDEIGELPLNIQVLLLRVIQEKTFQRVGSSRKSSSDFRLISATNRPLVQESGESSPTNVHPFRDDLFHRIAVGVIKIPPLRKRGEGLQRLADYFLERLNDDFAAVPGYRRKELTVAARKLVAEYSWPGNVRELINTITRACLWGPGEKIDEQLLEQSLVRKDRELSDSRRDEILSREIGNGFDLEVLLEDVKRHYVKRALEEAEGSKVKAAELLGFNNYQRLSNWMDKYGITADEFSSD